MSTAEDPGRAGGEQRRLRRDAVVNQERVLRAAVAAVLREGDQVPMSVIAAEAGVGVGTLYRRYPNREALLDALTCRAFTVVLGCARAADRTDQPGLACLDSFLDGVLARRGELVLPLHGGPAELSTGARAIRSQLHETLRGVLGRGLLDGSVRPDATTWDVVVFGAVLARPLPNAPDWPRTAARLKTVYLDGLAGVRPRQ